MNARRRREAIRLRAVPLALLLSLLSPLAPAQAQPRVREALSCERQGAAGGLAQGRALLRVDVDPLEYPNAICNDGTPAVFYVRPAATEATRNHWHIHLQGGGGCQDAQSCAQRWCSTDTNFGADKMSSLYAPPEGAASRGILGDDPRNPVGAWNQVLVYYCTSDGWMGRAEDRVLEAAGPQGDTVAYRMPFRGADVIDAVLAMLRREEGSLVVADPDGVAHTLPDLDEAERVLFAGASAGGGGVTRNADRVRALLRASNLHCAGDDCPLDFRALVDSTFSPETDDLDASRTDACAEDGLCSEDELRRWQWEEVVVGLRKGHETEDSCADWHRDNAPGTEHLCSSDEHVVEHHLATSLFVRMDLQDSLLSSRFVDAGYLERGRPVTLVDFGQRTESRLRRLAERAALSEEGLPAPVVLGAQCTRHETLRNDSFFDHPAPAADGLSYATADLLRNWLDGRGPREAIVPFSEEGRLPACDGEVLSGFPVDLTWTDYEGATGLGQPVGGSSDSGLFRFFAEDNWEVLVKVLDACSISDSLWVFAAATTDVGYTLRVHDPRTGQARIYTNPLGSYAAAITDTAAFPCNVGGEGTTVDDAATSASERRTESFGRSMSPGACTEDVAALCLNASRFEVRLHWRTADGDGGDGLVVPFRADDSGLFYFFDESNWELLVKVLDACATSHRFWVLAAATTDVEYELTVTDTATGQSRHYGNELGQPARAIIDTDAFACGDGS